MEKEIQKYETFEDYLDSLVIDDDQRYLGDIDTARKLVQLGYRSACQRSNTYFLGIETLLSSSADPSYISPSNPGKEKLTRNLITIFFSHSSSETGSVSF